MITVWGKVHRVFSYLCKLTICTPGQCCYLYCSNTFRQSRSRDSARCCVKQSRTCACLSEQRQSKGWEMGKTCGLSQCTGTDPDPSREGRCLVIYHERQMSSPREDSDTAWGQSHSSLAMLMVAEGCCLSPRHFEPLEKAQLFSSCTSLS